jgi:hypothetical protein
MERIRRTGETASCSARLPLTDDPVVDLHDPPEIAINLETITDVR